MSVPDDAESRSMSEQAAGGASFWSRHGDSVILGLLIVYVILLGIGTVAELFDIESILKWPIYR